MSIRDLDPYRLARQCRAIAAMFDDRSIRQELTCGDPEVDAWLAVVRAACPEIANKLRERAAVLEAANGESMVERFARAMGDAADAYAAGEGCDDVGVLDADLLLEMAANVIKAIRDPDLIEAACRKAADPRTGDVCWVGVSVHRAADIVYTVLDAALTDHA